METLQIYYIILFFSVEEQAIYSPMFDSAEVWLCVLAKLCVS